MSKSRMKANLKEWLPGYFFLIPALFFFVLFVIYPMLKGIKISLYNYTVKTYEFVGLSNFKQLLGDEVFIKSLINTTIIVLGNLPLVLVFSLAIAIIIFEKSEFIRTFFRAAFYLPAVASIVSISIVWRWMYSPRGGIINYFIGMTGIEPINWLGSNKFALPSIIIVLFTLSVGKPIILYTASLGNIPKAYLEVADIDGASWFAKILNIYWPLIKPTTLYIIIITTINSFQTFAIIQLLTGGGPMHRTSTILFLLYKSAFEFQNYGLAATMGLILAIIIILISIIQYKYLSSDIEY